MGDTEGTYKERLRAYSYKLETSEVGNMVNPTTGKSTGHPGSAKKSLIDSATQPEEQEVDKMWNLLQALQSAVNEVKLTTTADPELEGSVANRLNLLEGLASENKLKIKVLSNIVIRQEEHIYELQEALNFQKRDRLRKNVVVSGLPEDEGETKEQLKTKVTEFFKSEMEIDSTVDIKQVCRAGPDSMKDRPAIVKLDNMQDKAKIFKHATKLKGKENARKNLFYVNYDLEPIQAEKRKQFRQLRRDKKEKEWDMDIKFKRNRLIVNNMIIRQKVKAPSAADILRLSEQERETLEHVKLVTGQLFSEKGSDYYTYIQRVKSVNDVRRGYLKSRFTHGDATHISCAYRLAKALGPFDQEGVDDWEIGAGRTMLEVSKMKSVTNIAVFVVRYYGGCHLGNRRYQILENLTTDAVATFQYKFKDRQSRLDRSLSQSSLASMVSTTSELSVEGDSEKPTLKTLPQHRGDLSQDDQESSENASQPYLSAEDDKLQE